MMKNFKHLLFILVVFIGTFMFVPKVFAERYFELSNYELNDNPFNNMSYSTEWLYYDEVVRYGINNTGKFKFDLKAYELDSTKEYDVNLKSDYIDDTKTYTGSQLMGGVSITINDAKSTIDLTIKEKNTNNYVNIKYIRICSPNDSWCVPESYYNKLALYFDDTQDFTEVNNLLNSLVKNGKIKTNSLKLAERHTESSITVGLKDHDFGKFDVYGWVENNQGKIEITDSNNPRHSKTFNVDWEFANGDKAIQEKLNKYASKFDFDISNIEDNLFALVDLENLNYKYATLYNKNELDVMNSIINYTSEIHKYFDNDNIELILDARAGWYEDFTDGGFGFLNLLYDDVVYAVAEPVGVKQINVIYVPDDTPKNRDAFISAAKKRINEYLKDVNVEITYGGLISSIDTSDWIYPLDKLIDVTKTTGEYFNVKLNDTTFKFFIEANSSKMNVPFMNTKDIKTNIYVTSDSFEAPLDSKLSVNVLDKNSDEYKSLMKKLNLTDGKAVDLKLFSTTMNTYVSKLSNGKFRVFIPVDENQVNGSLTAYYYNDNGTIETHDVKIENGYAIFETDHFSTYVLSSTSNPNTGDSILKYLVLSIICLTGIVFTVIYFKRTVK